MQKQLKATKDERRIQVFLDSDFTISTMTNLDYTYNETIVNGYCIYWYGIYYKIYQ